MRYIKTSDLILGLNDLFKNKIIPIQDLAAFVLFGGPLDDKRRTLAAIYRGMKTTPFVNRLKEKDAVHAGAGRILYFFCKTFRELPTLTDEERDFWCKLKEEAKRTKQLNVVRVETVGLLHGFRNAIAQEVAVNDALLRDLEAQVFSFFDQLDGNRQGISVRSAIPVEIDSTESVAPESVAPVLQAVG